MEQFSQYLSTKVRQSDPTSSYNAASRLLATEGLNPRQYTLALQNFQVMPTYEEKPERGADVQTYVEQVHNSLSSKAIQVAHENAMQSFEKHIDSYLEATWQREKKALFDTGDPYAAPLQQGSGHRDQTQPQAIHVLRGKAARYADVVKAMNKAISDETKEGGGGGGRGNEGRVPPTKAQVAPPTQAVNGTIRFGFDGCVIPKVRFIDTEE